MAWPCKSLLERWHAFAVETPSKHGPAACSNLPSQSTSALIFLKCDKRPPSWGGRCAWLSSSSTVDRDSIRRRARNNVARNNLARNKHRRQQHRGQQHRRQQHRRLPLLQGVPHGKRHHGKRHHDKRQHLFDMRTNEWSKLGSHLATASRKPQRLGSVAALLIARSATCR